MFLRLQTVYFLLKEMYKLPTLDSVQDLSKQFADYFIQKIVIIHRALCQSIKADYQCDETGVISNLGPLNPTTNEDISKIIRSAASKSCDLDSMHWFLKLLKLPTVIINLSLSTSTVPYDS